MVLSSPVLVLLMCKPPFTSEIGFGAIGEKKMGDNVSLGAGIDYWSVNQEERFGNSGKLLVGDLLNISDLSFSAYGKYSFPVAAVQPFLRGGLSSHLFSFGSLSMTFFGVDAAAGLDVPITQQLAASAEARFRVISAAIASYFDISAGLRMKI